MDRRLRACWSRSGAAFPGLPATEVLPGLRGTGWGPAGPSPLRGGPWLCSALAGRALPAPPPDTRVSPDSSPHRPAVPGQNPEPRPGPEATEPQGGAGVHSDARSWSVLLLSLRKKEALLAVFSLVITMVIVSPSVSALTGRGGAVPVAPGGTQDTGTLNAGPGETPSAFSTASRSCPWRTLRPGWDPLQGPAPVL